MVFMFSFIKKRSFISFSIPLFASPLEGLLKHASRMVDIWLLLDSWFWMKAEMKESTYGSLSVYGVYLSVPCQFTQLTNQGFLAGIFCRTEFEHGGGFCVWKHSFDHQMCFESFPGTHLGIVDIVVNKTGISQLFCGLCSPKGNHTWSEHAAW